MAAACGIAVTDTMAIDTLLASLGAYSLWKKNLRAVLALGALFFAIDLSFFTANLFEIPHGGWFSLVIGALVFTLLATWKKGRALLQNKQADESLPLEPFLGSLMAHPPVCVPGTAGFLTTSSASVPHALLHRQKCYTSA